MLRNLGEPGKLSSAQQAALCWPPPPCHQTAHADLSDLQNREDKRFRLAVGTFKEEMQNRVELVTCETAMLELHRLTPCTASNSGAPAWPGDRNLLPGHEHQSELHFVPDRSIGLLYQSCLHEHGCLHCAQALAARSSMIVPQAALCHTVTAHIRERLLLLCGRRQVWAAA